MVPLVPLFVVIFATFIGAFGSLYLKLGARRLHRANLHTQFINRDLMIGIFLYILSAIFYVGAMKYGELSILYPVTSISYIWISFLSISYLEEHMNAYKWTGIALIILGVVLITQ
jgi:uncharacterized membrane protein